MSESTRESRQPLRLSGFQTKHGNLPTYRSGHRLVVGVSRVDLLSQGEKPRIFFRVRDLLGGKALLAELAVRIRLQVVVPLRMFGPAVVGGNQDHVGTIMKVRQLNFAPLTGLGARGYQGRVDDPAHVHSSTGKAEQVRIGMAGDVSRNELSGARAPKPDVGSVHESPLLVRIYVTQWHAPNRTTVPEATRGFAGPMPCGYQSLRGSRIPVRRFRIRSHNDLSLVRPQAGGGWLAAAARRRV